MHARASSGAFFRTNTTIRIVTIAIALWVGAAACDLPTAHAATTRMDAQERSMRKADGQGMVDCMLPGQIRRLDNQATIMGARHPIRTTRADCHARGGEYRTSDRKPIPARPTPER